MNQSSDFFCNMVIKATSTNKLEQLIKTFEQGMLKDNTQKYELLIRLAKLKIFCIDRLIDYEIINKYLTEFYNRGGTDSDADIKKKIVIIEKIYIFLETQNSIPLKKAEQLILENYNDTNSLEKLLDSIKKRIREGNTKREKTENCYSINKKKEDSSNVPNIATRLLNMTSTQRMILMEMAQLYRQIELFAQGCKHGMGDTIFDRRTIEIEDDIAKDILNKMQNSLNPKLVQYEEFKKMAFNLYARDVFKNAPGEYSNKRTLKAIELDILEEEALQLEKIVNKNREGIIQGETNIEKLVEEFINSERDSDKDDNR